MIGVVGGELVGLLAVVGLRGVWLVGVVAGVSGSGGLVVVDADSVGGAVQSILRESTSLLLNTAASASSHVGIVHFEVAAGCLAGVVGVLVATLLLWCTCVGTAGCCFGFVGVVEIAVGVLVLAAAVLPWCFW